MTTLILQSRQLKLRRNYGMCQEDPRRCQEAERAFPLYLTTSLLNTVFSKNNTTMKDNLEPASWANTDADTQ